MTPIPPCFDSERQYRAWLALARKSYQRVTPCADCTSAYRAEMLRQGRCEPAYRAGVWWR